MTRARKAALQWFHDRGEIRCAEVRADPSSPTINLIRRMLDDLQLSGYQKGRAHAFWYCLTDKGRRDLHEAGS